jgi:hypothetical protein
MQPRLESVWISQARQVAPGPNECFLNRVSGRVAITNDETGGGVDPRGVRAKEHCEGVAIASLCPLDERPLVHGSPV